MHIISKSSQPSKPRNLKRNLLHGSELLQAWLALYFAIEIVSHEKCAEKSAYNITENLSDKGLTG